MFISFVYVLPLEIQLSRGEDWDSINRFIPAIFSCLFQARTLISDMSWFFFRAVIVHFVDIGGIDVRHYLNFLFITQYIFINK